MSTLYACSSWAAVAIVIDVNVSIAIAGRGRGLQLQLTSLPIQVLDGLSVEQEHVILQYGPRCRLNSG